MTTSSPGCQRVTPSPTFHTMPEASEPPMWWSSGWERKTETGFPSAAQTLLKLTPAAITRTITSKAPGSGTSISSIWKASRGSPSRSSRITQAAIVSGRVPGSTSSSETFVMSTAKLPRSPGWPDATRTAYRSSIATVKALLIGVPASHPTVAAELMLARKGIEIDRFDLVPGLHRFVLRRAFPDGTVPAMVLDGRRLQGTRTISRALDVIAPEPALFPAEPERRAARERAELWGDLVLQPVVRRLAWAALKRDRSTIDTFLDDARLGLPTGLAVATAAPVAALSARLNRASDRSARRDLEALPRLL